MQRLKMLAPGQTFIRSNGEGFRLVERRAGSRFLIERLDDGARFLTGGGLMVTRESF